MGPRVSSGSTPGLPQDRPPDFYRITTQELGRLVKSRHVANHHRWRCCTRSPSPLTDLSVCACGIRKRTYHFVITKWEDVMGRRPIGDRAMTATERQRRRLDKLVAEKTAEAFAK